MTDPRPLRVGLIGAGTIARLAQLPSLAADPSVTIAGVVTGSAAETDEVLRRWPIERGYGGAEELLEHAAVDAIFVLTPKQLHTQYVQLGIQAGVGVYCEKPLASTLEDAERLASAAQTTSAPVMVGLNRRFAPVYQEAHALMKEPPLFAVGQKHRVGSEYRATIENGIHMVDLLRWFCGDAIEVTATSAGDQWAEDGTAAMIRFDSGATALFLAARVAGEWDERLELFGANTTVRVVAPDQMSVVTGGRSTTMTMRAEAAGWVDITMSAGFAPAVAHFLDCVRTGRRPLTDAAEGLASLRLALDIVAAAGLPTSDRDDA
ncbi:MAG: Gfo/Idh/MocA family protein [Nostocoides sp.]